MKRLLCVPIGIQFLVYLALTSSVSGCPTYQDTVRCLIEKHKLNTSLEKCTHSRQVVENVTSLSTANAALSQLNSALKWQILELKAHNSDFKQTKATNVQKINELLTENVYLKTKSDKIIQQISSLTTTNAHLNEEALHIRKTLSECNAKAERDAQVIVELQSQLEYHTEQPMTIYQPTWTGEVSFNLGGANLTNSITCEGETNNLSCDTEETIRIIYASYGPVQSPTCGEERDYEYRANRTTVITSIKLLCEPQKQNCTVQASTDLSPDGLCDGRKTNLEILYTCVFPH